MKWIGTGVLSVKGKDYGYGDDIPTKGISPERIAQLKKKGKIGEVPVAGPSPEIARLNARTAELEAIVKAAQKGMEELEAEGKKLADDNAALRAELEKAPFPPAPPASESEDQVETGAGPLETNKKGKK